MVGVLFLLCFSAYVESSDFPRFAPILGGETADIKDFPYQLALEFNGGVFHCGASIIHSLWAVTAAHCTERHPEDTLVLRSGSSYRLRGGTLHSIEKIVDHPEYNSETKDYDVSVLKVSIPFVFSDVAQKILLATETPLVLTPAVISGWGALKFEGSYPDQLQQVTVYIQDYDICKQNYPPGAVTPHMLCAGVPEGDKDACKEDSGGPLVAKGKLVGVVSLGMNCGEKDYPGLYTDVAKVCTWITSHITQ